MIPVVAIVGRPNVGKSTLFNGFTESRDALVSDLPGLTRDRQYGEVDLYNRHFIVIDTGGLTDDNNDLHQLTAEQSLQAIHEADRIIFVVDGRSGVTPGDTEIVKKLRPLNKPVVLVVNKTEGLDAEVVNSEFYQLGIGAPIAISAAHKSGLDDIIHALFPEAAGAEAPVAEPTSIQLAIIGRPNVGKSTLTNRILGEERVIVFDQPGTTRDSIFIPMERQGKQYTLIDTAGVRRRGKIFEAVEKFSVVKTLQAVKAAQVVLFIMDAREGVTEQDLHLLGFILDAGKALVIAMNKWDGMSDYDRDLARATIDRRLRFVPFVRVHYISALHGSGVGNLFASVDEAYASAMRPLVTSELTQLLESIVHTHIPPLVQGRRIKLRYAHAGGHNPPLIIIHGNQVHALPLSYQRYLANAFQERLKLMGTPVKIEFKSGENPYRHKKNPLNARQQRKKMRMVRHSKR